MIHVTIEMDPTSGTLNITSSSPPLVALAAVTAAYHELLSKKIQADMKGEQRIIQVNPATPPYPFRPPTGSDDWKRAL